MTCPELSFPVATYRISAVLQGDFTLPDYAGSMLRGIYGHALRRISCMTGQRTCDECPLLATCPYPVLFDPAIDRTHRGHHMTSGPPPYVIQGPEWGEKTLKEGEEITFAIRLIGCATGRLPFVIQAWRQALGRGMGRKDRRVRAHLSHIDWLEGEQRIFDITEGNILPHDPAPPVLPRDKQARNLTLQFNTPYRSQQQGHPLSVEQVTPRRLISDVIRRIRLLDDFHGDGLQDHHWPVDCWLDMADRVSHDNKLHWQDWRRYSGRQKKTMSLGGLMGKWHWQQVPPELTHLLRLGCLLHLGKQTVFGFGHMTVLDK